MYVSDIMIYRPFTFLVTLKFQFRHQILYSFGTDRNCGQRPPTNPLEVISSGNFMLINLITDSMIQRPGFEAHYRAIPTITGIINTSPHIMLHVLIFFLKHLQDDEK